MTDYGITADGFLRMPLDVILEEIESEQRALIDPKLNTESDSVIGQLNGIYAEKIAQLWEVLEALYYSLSRSSSDDALDIVGALTGTPRNGKTKSKVTLTLSLAAHTTVSVGSIVSVNGDPSIRAVTTADAVNDGGTTASVDVAAEAETAGNVHANPTTMTVIETPIAGWLSVTNAAEMTGGTDVEGDDAYRLRQLTELAAGGGGSVPGIESDLRKIDGVTAVRVIENDSEVTVGSQPPKSIEAIVQGGDPQDIAGILFGSKSGGVYAHGTATPVTVTDAQGVDHTVRYSRPTSRTVYVAIAVKTAGTLDTPMVTAIQNAIVAATTNRADRAYLDIGSDVYAATIVLAALGVSGVINAVVGLSFSSITDPATGSSSLVIGDRELASVAGHISVTSL